MTYLHIAQMRRAVCQRQLSFLCFEDEWHCIKAAIGKKAFYLLSYSIYYNIGCCDVTDVMKVSSLPHQKSESLSKQSG